MYSQIKDSTISEAFDSDSERSDPNDEERLNDDSEDSDDLMSELRDEIGDGISALVDKDNNRDVKLKRR